MGAGSSRGVLATHSPAAPGDRDNWNVTSLAWMRDIDDGPSARKASVQPRNVNAEVSAGIRPQNPGRCGTVDSGVRDGVTSSVVAHNPTRRSSCLTKNLSAD